MKCNATLTYCYLKGGGQSVTWTCDLPHGHRSYHQSEGWVSPVYWTPNHC